MGEEVVVVGIIVLVFYALAVVGLLADRRDALGSRGWPSVVGRVTESRILDAAGKSSLLAVIGYVYEIGGRSYEGHRIAAAGDREDPSVPAYAVGASVPVYYDPARPWLSVLEPGDPNGRPAFRIVRDVVLTVGAAAAVVGIGIGIGIVSRQLGGG